MNRVRVIPWAYTEAPTKNAIRSLLDGEGLTCYTWGNDPLDTYSAHTHPYHKVIYVTQGNITFYLPETGQSVTLKPGDRLELPAGTLHSAAVGVEGVECLEAHF